MIQGGDFERGDVSMLYREGSITADHETAYVNLYVRKDFLNVTLGKPSQLSIGHDLDFD